MTDEELAKDRGLVSAMTIGIGTMIGAGIFVLPGVAAAAVMTVGALLATAQSSHSTFSPWYVPS